MMGGAIEERHIHLGAPEASPQGGGELRTPGSSADDEDVLSLGGRRVQVSLFT